MAPTHGTGATSPTKVQVDGCSGRRDQVARMLSEEMVGLVALVWVQEPKKEGKIGGHGLKRLG